MWMNQSIQRPWGVSAFGSAIVDAIPDVALFRFACVSVANKPADAFKGAHKAGARIRDTLVSAGIEEGAVQTSRVTLESAFEFSGGQQRFVGYRARLAYRVRATNLDEIEELVAAVVDAGANVIEALDFQSSQLRQLRADARAAAVVAARQKAEIYAQAAGAKLGPLLHIEDVNPDALDQRTRGHAAPVDLGQLGDGPDVLRPGSITIAAAVLAGFAIHPA